MRAAERLAEGSAKPIASAATDGFHCAPSYAIARTSANYIFRLCSCGLDKKGFSTKYWRHVQLIRVSVICVRFSSFGLEFMTQILDVALRRDLCARWCTLAEQRLQHLTDLFESGRWRRYYGERAFLENIKEAKKAVEAWRALSGRPVARKDDAPALARQERRPGPLWRPSAPPTETAFVDPDSAMEEVPRELTVDLVALEQALIAPPPAADLATMEQRYPLLRNALL
jgi:hypothetical protein